MIIRKNLPTLIDSTAKNRVSKRVAGGVHVPAPIDKGVSMLSSDNGVQHNCHVAAGRILHAGRDIKATDSHSMLLVFYGTGTNCHIREQICQIPPVLRVKHLIRCGKAGLLNISDMKLTNCNQTFQKIWCCFRIRLMNHSLVSFTGSTWLVGINTWNDDAFIFNLLLDRNQTVQVIHDSRLIICGTRSDDYEKSVVCASDHVADLFISLCFFCCIFRGKRIHGFDLLGDRQLFIECESHGNLLCY